MLRRNFLAISIGSLGLSQAATRQVTVETVFKSPGPKPNGLQATDAGLWILDQGDNRAYLVDYRDGKVIRRLDTESKAGSGITFDGEALWLASTYSCEIIRADANTGRTLAKYPSPGSGVVKWTSREARKSPLAPPAKAEEAPASPSAKPQQKTGAHGLEWKDGRLWIAVPPAQMIYIVNPEGFRVENHFPTVGNRPHGLGWEGGQLWCTDSNLNAFFKVDTKTGKPMDKIQLKDSDPLPHGMTIWKGFMWYCDDVGVVCRFKMS